MRKGPILSYICQPDRFRIHYLGKACLVGHVYRTKESAMSNLLSLAAKKRDRSTKAALNNMRKEGRVPAIVYGLEKDPEMIEVTSVDMRPHLSQRNHVIELSLEGGASQKVMIKAVERDPIRKDLVHIDFLRVNNERPVIVSVPVTTFGVPVGVKTQGGVFSTMKKFVKLRAKVQDIPDKFDMDVSDINSGTIIYVRDLKFDKGTFVTPGKTALYGVTTGKAEVEEVAPAAAPAAAAPAAGAEAAKPGDKKEEKGGKDKK
jgi:large subunit ribosomal protein L25